MKTSIYTQRNKIGPKIKGKSRYVTGMLHSHRRPVEIPESKGLSDDPEYRGLTKEENA